MIGGDASLVLSISKPCCASSRPDLVCAGGAFAFSQQNLRIDARAQALVTLLEHTAQGSIEPLEAESLALTLVSRGLGPRTARAPGATTRAAGWSTGEGAAGRRSVAPLDAGGDRARRSADRRCT